MSVYYSIGGATPTFLASNTGWSDAGHFVESLDPEAYPLAAQFRTHGWAEPAGRLAAELRECLRSESPDEDVAGVLRELLAGADDAGPDGILVLSDGGGTDDAGPAKEDRSGLVKKTVTDKTGKKTTVYVSPDQDAPAGKPAAKGDAHDPKTAAHAATALPDLPAEVTSNPKLMARLGGALLTVAAKVHLRLTAATPALLTAMGVAKEIFDTPDDLKKFGYAPSSAGTASADATGRLDPMRAATGLSTHLACSVASHVLAKGYVWAKKRMAGKTESEADWAGLAELMAEVFAAVNESLGLEGAPDAGEVEAKLREVFAQNRGG